MYSFIALILCFMAFGCAEPKPKVQRFGRVSAICPDRIESYKELHAEAWPDVLEQLSNYNINNYSIYLKELEEGKHYLFSYYEYTGDDFDTDMAVMLKNPKVQEWENLTSSDCLIDQPPDRKGEWWSDMEEVFYYEGMTGQTVDESKVQRYGMVIGIRPEMIESYKLLHKYTWPEVLDKIAEGNIRNYSIYLHELDGRHYLFSYFEYAGEDFEADMALVDNDPATIAWMKFTDEVCQIPLTTRTEGEWWAVMDQVFYKK